MPTYTLIDLVGIQDFVFASNRLQDVVGGSRLVREATRREGWLRDLGLEDAALVAAGGNALLRSDDPGKARDAAARFTRKLLDEAPGLAAAVAHREADGAGFARALERLHEAMREEKARRRPSLEALGLGVTASCRETGAVATELWPGTEPGEAPAPVAAGVAARRRALRSGTSELVEEDAVSAAPGAPVRQLRFPIQNDELGRSPGEKSLLGVIHVDANAVGSRLARWLGELAETGVPDEEVERRFVELSKALDRLVSQTWRGIVERVKARIRWNPKTAGHELESPALGQSFPLAEDARRGRLFLPVRPILLGGDDLTFLCDGRLALDLAEHALAAFESATLPELGAIGACAGAVLVPAHAPFSRAVEWAHRLCARAKRRVVETTDRERIGFALDWHVGLPSPLESVDALRRRLYRAGSSAGALELTCRPYPLGAAGERATWRWLAATVLGAPAGGGGPNAHSLRGPRWADHRNKVKALESLARGGRDEVRGALEAWRAAHPDLVLPGGLDPDGGFLAHRTPLIDATELLDLHWPLDPPLAGARTAATESRPATAPEEPS